MQKSNGRIVSCEFGIQILTAIQLALIICKQIIVLKELYKKGAVTEVV